MGMEPAGKPHQADHEEWLPLIFEHERGMGKRRAQLWALVLDARSIPCCIESTGEGWILLVPRQYLERARAEIRLYEENNRNWPPSPRGTRTLLENTLPAVSVLVLLATFHNLTLLDISLPGHGPVDFHDLGAALGSAILGGEWWRLVTALTLHADFVHLLGNLAIGGIVIIPLCHEFGAGLAWSLILFSGALGNLANTLARSPDHSSFGASTAVFGAIGILSAVSALRRRLSWRLFVPVAAGLALLALLGSGGRQTDLGAHLFGFASGLLLGLLTELSLGGRARPGRLLNAVLALSAAMVVSFSWWMALTLSGK